jgi:hypothetical protein
MDTEIWIARTNLRLIAMVQAWVLMIWGEQAKQQYCACRLVLLLFCFVAAGPSLLCAIKPDPLIDCNMIWILSLPL